MVLEEEKKFRQNATTPLFLLDKSRTPRSFSSSKSSSSVKAQRTTAIAASSAFIDDEEEEEEEPLSSSSDRNRRHNNNNVLGTVVTAQANYFRVVVNRRHIPSKELNRVREQFDAARKKAEEARATKDVESLNEKLGKIIDIKEEEEEEEEDNVELLCNCRALLKKMKQKVLVGDVVTLDSEKSGIDWVERSGTIYGIEKRKNEGGNNLAIANVDVTLLTFSLSQPPLERSS